MTKEIKKISSEEFILEVESLVQNKKLDYMDAVLHFCDIRGIEMDVIASIIKNNPKIKARMQEEAEELNLLPKKNRLPI